MILRKIKAMCQLLSGREHNFLSMSNSEPEFFVICFADIARECLGQKQWHLIPDVQRLVFGKYLKKMPIVWYQNSP